MKLFSHILIALLTLIVGVASVAQEIDQCDTEAGHPSDPNHLGAGKPTNEVVTHVAIPACRAAIEREPENARFHYQLGRAMYYWAGANDADTSEAIRHIEVATDKGYTQALFVRGLLYKNEGKFCSAEPLMKAAADKGLKSARITYVDDVASGLYSSCDVSATKEQLRAYLSAAGDQVSGYYEGMLLRGIGRSLAVWENVK